MALQAAAEIDKGRYVHRIHKRHLSDESAP
jgi:hypothetical protein